MRKILRILALSFSAGCIGGLTNSLVVWLSGVLGITVALGVSIAPNLTPDWLYPRIVWGGLWGFLFIAPLLKNSPYLRGLMFSLGPTVIQLFFIFPFVANKELLGLGLGTLTPVFVVFFNAVWGIVAAILLTKIENEPDSAT